MALESSSMYNTLRQNEILYNYVYGWPFWLKSQPSPTRLRGLKRGHSSWHNAIQVKNTSDNEFHSYKSPFTYADAKKSDGYSSFVDMEDAEKEYQEAKQGVLLKWEKKISCKYLIWSFSQASHPSSHRHLLRLLRPHLSYQLLLLHQDSEKRWEDGGVQTRENDR